MTEEFIEYNNRYKEELFIHIRPNIRVFVE